MNSNTNQPRSRIALQSRAWDARLWSNDALRQIGSALVDCRSVVNISGWKDSDKEGGVYRRYFPHAVEYQVSNHPLDQKKGVISGSGMSLDLDTELPPHLRSAFDIAFSHTVLEHVRNPWFSFHQIVQTARIGVITIVPFKQPLHFEPGNFGDYFRFSPLALRAMYEAEGLVPVHESFSCGFNTIYALCFGTKPEAAENYPSLKKTPDYRTVNHRLGQSGFRELALSYASRLIRKLAR